MHEIFRDVPSQFKRLSAPDTTHEPKYGHCVVSGSVT
jgi:hypothetical protein